MTARKRTIELDEATAMTLQSRADERGLSVSELAANELATMSPEELADLDRQWAAIRAGEPTVPHEDVVQWLRTWGTPEFKPSREYNIASTS